MKLSIEQRKRLLELILIKAETKSSKPVEVAEARLGQIEKQVHFKQNGKLG